MKKLIALVLAVVLGTSVLSCVACSTTSTERLQLGELQTVERVDINRYLGLWYEIASFPHSFQKGCTGSTAYYTKRSDGEINVINRCYKGSLNGKLDEAEGRARVVDATTNAKLEVTFFWPFWGDYWVIDLCPDYQFAVVGHPSRDYLWVLCRQPQMDPAVYAGIIERLKAQGYETERLNKTLQPASTGS